MGLLSFFKRPSGPRAGARGGAAATASSSTDAARTRARRRLIGAAVLVGLGVVGFPLLFDTAPRPQAGDIAIEVQGRAADPLPVPAAAKPAMPAPSVAEAPRATAAVASAPAKAVEAPVETPVAVAPAPAPTDKPAAAEPKAEAAKALAALQDKPTAPDAATGTGRFVVQVGAFSTADAARGARERAEKLGLKTYTQVVDTSAGPRTRVRVGPYGDRSEAEKAAALLKQVGLPTAILSL